MMTLRGLWLCCTAGVLLSAGCGGPPDASSSTMVTDDLGRLVAIPRPLHRVVTLAPNLTEVAFAAGGGAKIVAVSTADDYPPAVDTIPRFSALPLDYEAVVALEPDLVLATDHVNAVNDAATFEAVGVPVFFFSYNSLDGLLRSVRTAGSLMGTAERAGRAADSLGAEIDALRRLTAAVDHRPTTLFLIGDETLYAFGRESYIHEMIALAGGRSATEDFAMRAPVLNDEFVLTRKPEVIVGAFGEDYDPARLLALHPTWDVVPAVRDGRVYGVDPDLYLRPTPRLVEGIRRMAAKLHPELFEGL